MSSQLGSPSSPSAEEPASRKRRRDMSRSDEEILEEMDDAGLSYRMGWPQLPPLPLDTTLKDAKNSVENGYKILEEVQTILDLQRVYAFEIYFAYRVPRGANPSDDIKQYHTLVVEINSTSSGSYQKAIIRVRQLLKGYEATMDTNIEFIDHRAVKGLFTRGLRHYDTAAIEAWDSVSDIIISELREKNAAWSCIEAGHRGLSDDQCSLTAIITSPTASDRAWTRDTLPALRLWLRFIVPKFEVEVLCGKLIFAKSQGHGLDGITEWA